MRRVAYPEHPAPPDLEIMPQRRLFIIAAVCLALAAGLLALWNARRPLPPPHYVGTNQCAICHQGEYHN